MYLVRHGATANNLADPPLLQGRGADFDLSETGLWQAERTAELLSNPELPAVFSSPLLRARRTAETIAKPHDLNVQTVADLQEVDVGEWEGRSWQEISVSDPERYQRFMEDSANHGYLNGENMTQVLDRVRPAIENVMRERIGEHIVVVAHNVVNRVYLASLLNIPVSRARGVNQDNCGVSIVRYCDGKTKLIALNSIFHLSDRPDG
jgi:broad specificity phosphatase PhoE